MNSDSPAGAGSQLGSEGKTQVCIKTPLIKTNGMELGCTATLAEKVEICTPIPVRQPVVARLMASLNDSPRTVSSPFFHPPCEATERPIVVSRFEPFLEAKPASSGPERLQVQAKIQSAAPYSGPVFSLSGMQGSPVSAFQPVRQALTVPAGASLPPRRVLKRLVASTPDPKSGCETSKMGAAVQGQGQIQVRVQMQVLPLSEVTTTTIEKPYRKKAKEESKEEESSQGISKGLQCKHCEMVFTSGQALGGHMSRKHTGKSVEYNYKKDVRKKRKFDRMKLLLAKKLYFMSLHYDYDVLSSTPEGKLQAKVLMNRSKIKRLKSRLTDEEVNNFMDAH